MNYQRTTTTNEHKPHKCDFASPSVNEGNKKIKITEIEDEYAPDNTIFNEEDNLTYQIKNIIFNDLDVIERRIILLYAEEKSLRKTGKLLNISTSKCFQIIHTIREKIKNKLYANNN